MATEPYRDKNGDVIPWDHFENEPGPPRPLSETMSPEALRQFNARTEAQIARLKLAKKIPPR